MAMSKGGNQPAGGYGSRQHVEKPIRTGSGSRSTNPGGVGQIGEKQVSHITRHSDSICDDGGCKESAYLALRRLRGGVQLSYQPSGS